MATLMSIFNDLRLLQRFCHGEMAKSLRISESILGLDFNQMSDDEFLALETPIC